MRVVFFGTPSFAVPTLDALVASPHDVVGVVTQPDRPRGRGHRLRSTEVKARALEAGLPILQPERLDEDAFLDQLRALRPDLAVVAAYGRLLPQRLIDLPVRGTINVHASLLPRWRGAAPVHRAVLAGDQVTGVTIMRVVLALDAGPMLAREATPIDPQETSQALERRLSTIGARLLVDVVGRMARGDVPETPQDAAERTYASRLQRSESRVAWDREAVAVHNQIRGLQPWPLAAAVLNGQRVLLRSSEVGPDAGAHPAGTVVAVEPAAIVVAARPGSGTVRLTELQPEGRAPMPVRAFLNGHPVTIGDRFDPDGT